MQEFHVKSHPSYRCLLIAIVLVFPFVSNARYYLSPNPLNHSKAEWYCNSHCSSHLVSIHNASQFARIKDIVNASYDVLNPPLFNSTPYFFTAGNATIDVSGVWIGLQRPPSGGVWAFSWTDSSPFDYGASPQVQGTYPWSPAPDENPSNNGDCVHLWGSYQWTWNDYPCDHDMRVMCDECPGKMHKYILIKQAKNWTDAQSFCRQNIGTDLASIHSEDDYEDAKALCQANNDDCYIGLIDISPVEQNWIWIDGTSFDFGSNTAGGAYPWAANEPNNNGDGVLYATHLWNDREYLWNDINIAGHRDFLCNAPSELCTASQWNRTGDLFWSDLSCDVHSGSQSQSIIHHKHWAFDGELWRIDYLFTVHDVPDTHGEAGVVIYHFDSFCDYYYAGMQIDSVDGAVYVFLDQHYQGTSTRLFNSSSPLFAYEFDRFYKFSVELAYPDWQMSVFTATETFVFNYTDLSAATTDLSDSKYIGLKNTNTNISAKSLFVSDSPFFDSLPSSISSIFAPDSCTTAPTTDPTDAPSTPTRYPSVSPTTPTAEPSDPPTAEPTEIPTADPTEIPAADPSEIPTVSPSDLQTPNPSESPTSVPSELFTTNSDNAETVSEQKDQTVLILIILVCVLSAVIIVGGFGICAYLRIRSKNDVKQETDPNMTGHGAEMAFQKMQSRSISPAEGTWNQDGPGMAHHEIVAAVNRTHGSLGEQDMDVVNSVDATIGNAVEEERAGEVDHETPGQQFQEDEFEIVGNTQQ